MSNETNQYNKAGFGRRRFLKLAPLAALSCILPRAALAALPDGTSGERSLSFYNTHTKEYLHAVYWADGKYLPDPLERINDVLRDHRTGEKAPIDTQLLDLLHLIQGKMAAGQPFHIISGYRSPQTNALLRSQNKAVARQSYHMFGKAVDFSIPGCRLSWLRKAAMHLKRGGVGYYPRNGFIHVDVGPIRYW